MDTTWGDCKEIHGYWKIKQFGVVVRKCEIKFRIETRQIVGIEYEEIANVCKVKSKKVLQPY